MLSKQGYTHAPNGGHPVRPTRDRPAGGLSRRFRRGLGRRSAVAATGLPLLLVGTLSVPATAAAKTPDSGAPPDSSVSHRATTPFLPAAIGSGDLTAFDNRPRPFGGDWAAGATFPVPGAAQPSVAQPAGAASAPAAPAATGSAQLVSSRGRSLGTFVVTCYDLQGRTASGASTSMETVAVDPRVIPLGTHLYISGVGERVAQDTGGAIKGNRLDIWEPTYGQCAAWGVENRQVWLG